jgi:hypothetical protein
MMADYLVDRVAGRTRRENIGCQIDPAVRLGQAYRHILNAEFTFTDTTIANVISA